MKMANKNKNNKLSQASKPKKNVRYFQLNAKEPAEVSVKNKKTKKQSLKPYRESHKKIIKKAKIDEVLLAKHSRGDKATEEGVRTKFFKEKLKQKESLLEYANEQAARVEILLNEEEGFIIPEENDDTAQLLQKELTENVDITAAQKHFKLDLDFGPYKLRYTKNGRHLLLGGRKGHIAALDWVTKKLHIEMNAMEEVADISWLHLETMFACAQKNWVHFYDKKGTELHCVKRLSKVNCLEFLPYHFLLASGSSEGYLSWLDVSIGEMVSQFNSKLGNIRLMRQNPWNGTLCIGGGKGVVTMWSPTVREPLAQILCHPTVVTCLTVDPKGKYLATSGLDRKLKIWDVRQLKGPMIEYIIRAPANEVEISQKGVLAVSMGNVCEMYKSTVIQEETGPFLRQFADGFIHGLRFCPYEDILGISSNKGFTSILVPGSGEPNYDALEANPFQTVSQRREHEVQSLLEKIPAEFITLDPTEILGVDTGTLEEKIEAKKQLLYVKPPKIEIKSKRKMKTKKGSANAAKSKQIVKETIRKEFIKEMKEQREKILENYAEKDEQDFIPLETPGSVLDRFKPKKRK